MRILTEKIFKKSHENLKVLIIFVIIAICCFFGFYCHIFCNVETVFTHFYYIPIIIASFWWKKSGTLIASLLGFFLIITHFFSHTTLPIYDDIIRAIIFILVGSFLDFLSERIDSTKQFLKENEENFRALAENANDGILIATGHDGHIIYANQMMTEITGYGIEEILSSDIETLASKKERKKILDYYRKRLSEENVPRQYESTFKRKNRKEIPVEITGARTFWHSRPADLVIVRDITQRKKTERKLLENQRKLKITGKNLKKFSQRILSIRDEEKKKISMNLHDEIGSMVVALSSDLSIAEEEIKDKDFEKAVESIHSTRSDLKRAVKNLKKIVIDLMPINLELIGLTNAIKEYLDGIRKQTNLNIEFNTSLNSEKINDTLAITFYRVLQESINNVIKHAYAKNVKIDLFPLKNSIQLRIYDDGRGFDVERLLKQKGEKFKIGIQGMRERVESLGGTFTIRSEFNKGCEICINVPIKFFRNKQEIAQKGIKK